MGDDSGEPISCIALLSVDAIFKEVFLFVLLQLSIFGDSKFPTRHISLQKTKFLRSFPVDFRTKKTPPITGTSKHIMISS